MTSIEGSLTMQIGLLGIAVLAGGATIASLWFYSPVLALLCAPFAASFVTGLAAVLRGALRKPTRHGPLTTRR
jgi:hypothetical protein